MSAARIGNGAVKDDVTPWFPSNVKPVRNGVYQVETKFGVRFAFWSGKFGYRTLDANNAYLERRSSTLLPPFAVWRGLASDPAGSAK